MHLLIILISLLIAGGLRYTLVKSRKQTWQAQWQSTLFCFLFPPLFIFMTIVAVYWMGHHGQMLGIPSHRWGCHLAIAFLLWSGLLLIYQTYQGWQSQYNLQQYPQIQVENQTLRLIPSSLPYSAQIGFWQPQLVVSTGLLTLLKDDHLSAVLAHEQAHALYKDTFWFFWLGYFKKLTCWLPYSEQLWQDLLLLREIRADQKALQSFDSLILAEALLSVAQFSTDSLNQSPVMAGFNKGSDRLEQRIEAILNPCSPWQSFSWQHSPWIPLIFLPLLTIPLHH
ncbi:MAG: M56 family metallopeptidase [Microcystaceae cyanobacterium]